MTDIFFGSISTVVDTSELQREAFNQAFDEHHLSWDWDRDDYRSRLGSNGGADRIAAYAEERGDDVDAAAVHATKTEIFQRLLEQDAPKARPGVVETIRAAREAGHRVGFVTSTSPSNVRAVIAAAGLTEQDFDVIVDADQVQTGKPDPEAFTVALNAIGGSADDAVAIEDNAGGLAAASAAGIASVAFPNENTASLDLSADRQVDAIDLDTLLPAARA